ncbi:MAG: type I restriction enzyme HsdR N-terminal domain-containing protein [Bacteroidales bacterium]|nr:type I restriction enzyme HsdR N-terminal domain-containing protein [Bacteroidales bacterium]
MAKDTEIWDPLRKKSVARTPEEEVRQWFIGAVLHEGMGVPEHMMMSEVSLTYNNMQRRADIVVYSRSGNPVMIVECKRPDVELGQETVDQALRYNKVLDVKYITITNGRKTFMFRRGDEGYVIMEKVPTWDELNDNN